MGWKFAAISRYRPRVLTLVVLFAVAAPIALANLTFDEGSNGHILHRSFGWPLIWHRYLSASWGWGYRTVGWYHSAARLAGNLAMWTAMLALAAGTCEWLLRRYHPQPRWSLRTMLVAVALAATLCGWFTRAHSRAKLNDEIIAALPPGGPGAYGTVLERAGPKWLGLLGVDRYRRAIVLAEPRRPFHGDNCEDEKLLYRLAQLPRLQRLYLVVDRFTPAMADALNGMNALRALKVEHAWSEYEDGVSFSRARLPPIGGMTELTKLELVDVTIDEESVAGLSKLKHLSINSSGVYPKNKTRDVWRGSLITVGKMPQLERLDLTGMTIKNNGLASLAGLANLKTLSLHYVRTSGPPLFDRLPPLPRLEVLELDSASITDRDLVQLAALPHLKSLSVSDARATAAGGVVSMGASFPVIWAEPEKV